MGCRRLAGPLMDDAGSWGEMLQQYEASKKARPLPDEAYAKPPRITAQQKAAEAARYNPVLQTFTDSSMEATARAREAEMVVGHLNRARDRQIASESTFDVLSMRDKRSGLQATTAQSASAPRDRPPVANQELPTFRHPLDSSYAYNIISGLSLAEHSYKPPNARPKLADTLEVTKLRLQSVGNLPRDYDVLSGKYVDSHDAKIDLERQIDRRRAAQRFWETHDYNTFTCEFYDPSKEAGQRALEAQRMKEQPMKAFNRLPPSLQKGEGHVYDIITHSVKNEALNEQKKAAEQRSLSKKDKWERDVRMRERGVQRAELQQQRMHNRGSYNRYEEAYGSGYSIIDHRDYVRDAPPPARVAPPPSLWSTFKPDAATPALVRSGGFQRVNAQ